MVGTEKRAECRWTPMLPVQEGFINDSCNCWVGVLPGHPVPELTELFLPTDNSFRVAATPYVLRIFNFTTSWAVIVQPSLPSKQFFVHAADSDRVLGHPMSTFGWERKHCSAKDVPVNEVKVMPWSRASGCSPPFL